MCNSSAITDKGKYRTHDDPMVIVSRCYDKQEVYFEAPPSATLQQEMSVFIDWFNNSKQELSFLERAVIAHVYFESIHPFEDGNGRIGRVLVEKALSQDLEHPVLIAISQIITKRKKEYYSALESCNHTLNVDNWIKFFSKVILQAQEKSFILINFLMSKTNLMSSLSGKINKRQKKALLRMFEEGPKGFSGEVSAENYISIIKASRATATRDLTDLVEKRALYKTGKLKNTRYWLNIDKME